MSTKRKQIEIEPDGTAVRIQLALPCPNCRENPCRGLMRCPQRLDGKALVFDFDTPEQAKQFAGGAEARGLDSVKWEGA